MQCLQHSREPAGRLPGGGLSSSWLQHNLQQDLQCPCSACQDAALSHTILTLAQCSAVSWATTAGSHQGTSQMKQTFGLQRCRNSSAVGCVGSALKESVLQAGRTGSSFAKHQSSTESLYRVTKSAKPLSRPLQPNLAEVYCEDPSNISIPLGSVL